MRDSANKLELRVGVATVIALAILIGGVIWAKGLGVGIHRRVVTMHFENAAGIGAGTPVTYNGVKKGEITGLRADRDGVTALAAVEEDVPLQSDATARIEMGELTGGKKVALYPGGSTRSLQAGAVIPGTVGGDPAALLDDAAAIAASVQMTLRRADSALSSLNQIVGDPRIRQAFESSALSLEEASSGARQIVAENRGAISQAVSSMNQLAREMRQLVAETEPAVRRTVGVAEIAAIDARRLIHSADSAAVHADSLIVRLDKMSAAIQQGKGAVNMLLFDPDFAKELRASLRETRQLVAQIKRHGFNVNVSIGSKR